MSVSDKIIQLYQRFYAQKNMLGERPPLTIDVNKIGAAEFPTDQAMAEMTAAAAYLMGRSTLQNVSFKEQVQIVRDAYGDQPFWQQLLFDYLDLTLVVEEARLKRESEELHDKTEELLFELKVRENHVEDIISHFADKIQSADFHVDAKNLLRNYFKMARRDAKEAWEMLIKNPAYFSPIVARDDNGKEVLSPAHATAENIRLAHFLKGLKG